LGPFNLALTFPNSLDRASLVAANNVGQVMDGNGILVVPTTASPMWADANSFDLVIQAGYDMRFNSVLRVQENETVPYYINPNISPTDVTIYNTSTNSVESVPEYAVTITGGTVILTGYQKGTPYVVSYSAWPIWVVYGEMGGMTEPHPWLGNTAYPRSMRIMLLDLWLRSQGGVNQSPIPGIPVGTQ
jgi:hypothetical protein